MKLKKNEIEKKLYTIIRNKTTLCDTGKFDGVSSENEDEHG